MAKVIDFPVQPAKDFKIMHDAEGIPMSFTLDGIVIYSKYDLLAIALRQETGLDAFIGLNNVFVMFVEKGDENFDSIFMAAAHHLCVVYKDQMDEIEATMCAEDFLS